MTDEKHHKDPMKQRIEMTPQSAFDLLLTIDSRHPWSLTTVASSTSRLMRLTVLIDGTPSEHDVLLKEDGTWTMSTGIEP